jgi:glycosyltransferase involved in cell wall biosynthesis
MMAGDATTNVTASIGLPVHNGGRYLGEAIGSALAQTFSDFELVICDNASTDDTAEICLGFQREDPRVRYVRNEINVGVVANHNRCVELSRGRYFMWLASDDLLGPSLLERCVDALENEPAATMAFPRLKYIDSSGAVTGSQTIADLSILAEDGGARAWKLMKLQLAGGEEAFSVFYSLLRRNALDRTGLHGPYVAGDQVLIFELVLAGKLAQADGAEFFRRRHQESSLMEQRTPEERAAWFDAEARRLPTLVHWTLFANHYRAIERSSLSRASKASAWAAVTYRAAREWRNLGGDLRYALVVSRRRRGRLQVG